MTNRISTAILVAVLFGASACSGGGQTDDAPTSLATEDRPALQGVERNLTDGARRVETTIDPAELDPARPPRPTIGDMTIPCGPAVGSRASSDEPGLTRDTISIGTGNDRGGLHTAGSGRGIPDAIRVLADRCNALGGINGRVIEVVERDAAVLEVEQQVRASCDEDFALVGHGYLNDSISGPVGSECGLLSFPAWTTVRPTAGSSTFVAVPTQPDQMVLDGLAVAVFAEGDDAGLVAAVVPATIGGRDAAARLGSAIDRAGLELAVATYEYPLDQAPRWDEIVTDARSAGASVVWVEGSCDSTLVPLLTAAQSVGWDPTVTGGSSLYDTSCAAQEPDLVEGTVLALPVHPAQDSGMVAALADHLGLFDAAGIELTADVLLAASAFWLWATATAECAEPLTRDCVTATARSVDRWTAGGLHAATGPAGSVSSGCVVLVAAVEGVFERLTPNADGAMDCRPDLLIDVDWIGLRTASE